MLSELGISDSLIRHLEAPSSASLLGYRCQSPVFCYSSPIIQKEIIPLWECGSVLTYYNKENAKFEKCSLEAIENVFFSHTSLQAALAELFIELYEDELSVQQLRIAASEAGFVYIDQLYSEAEFHQGADYASWCRSFPCRCNS